MEELALDLDRAATENKKIFLLGDYNLNSFNCNERNPTVWDGLRRFEPKEVPTKTQNLVIGSSLVKNMVGYNTIPEDICVHDYRGSTTCEKFEVVK